MELYQLKVFVTIARTGNLTRAAAELHASQPSISGQLKGLEEELGHSLFLRNSRGMELSLEGQRLLERAKEVVDGAAEFLALSAALKVDGPLPCKVGLNTTATALRIPELLEQLGRVAPQLAHKLELDFHQDQSPGVLRGIERKSLDAGFFFGKGENAGVSQLHLANIQLALVAPLAWNEALSHAPWALLLEKPWVLPPLTCPFYEPSRQLLASHGKLPSHRVTTNDESTMLELVRAATGIALLPETALSKEEGVCVIRRTQVHVALGFAWQTALGETTAVRLLRETLAELWAS